MMERKWGKNVTYPIRGKRVFGCFCVFAVSVGRNEYWVYLYDEEEGESKKKPKNTQ
jgi:hypothetical protein